MRREIRTNARPRATVPIRNGWKIVTRTRCSPSIAYQATPRPTTIAASMIDNRHRAGREPVIGGNGGPQRLADRHHRQRQIAEPREPLWPSPEVRKHVLGVLQLDAQDPEERRGQLAEERRSLGEIDR